jgi:methionine-rich copper-binding protein CopC
MTGFTRHLVLLTILAAAAASLSAPSVLSSSMHLRLTKSEPGKDSVVASPTVLKLWYSQKPQLRLSAVTMRGPSGEVKLGPVAQNEREPVLLTVPVEGRLTPGAYVISWRTASSDGHPIRGEIPFTVR